MACRNPGCQRIGYVRDAGAIGGLLVTTGSGRRELSHRGTSAATVKGQCRVESQAGVLDVGPV
jgi:hypothetical protein